MHFAACHPRSPAATICLARKSFRVARQQIDDEEKRNASHIVATMVESDAPSRCHHIRRNALRPTTCVRPHPSPLPLKGAREHFFRFRGMTKLLTNFRQGAFIAS
jgi:hypothetical protein